MRRKHRIDRLTVRPLFGRIAVGRIVVDHIAVGRMLVGRMLDSKPGVQTFPVGLDSHLVRCCRAERVPSSPTGRLKQNSLRASTIETVTF